jgi:acetyl-CoA carboxylase biotin carboxyl carrier protein
VTLHGRVVAAVHRGDELACPMPGVFRPTIGIGDVVRAGATLGTLDVLGRVARVVVPDDVPRGAVAELADGAVGFGTVLVRLDRLQAGADPVADARPSGARDDAAGAARVFRAPTSGRLYTRPGPDKPPFVAAGTELRAGATVCLLEVMKTFHRVTYAGEPARVSALLVADGADVDAGQPLLALE